MQFTVRQHAQVEDIMKAVDANGDGMLSRREYLVRIRRDRKYADFLRMPPRVKQADGTLHKFVQIFLEINISRTGFITRNELAAYLGVPPATQQANTLEMCATSVRSIIEPELSSSTLSYSTMPKSEL